MIRPPSKDWTKLHQLIVKLLPQDKVDLVVSSPCEVGAHVITRFDDIPFSRDKESVNQIGVRLEMDVREGDEILQLGEDLSIKFFVVFTEVFVNSAFFNSFEIFFVLFADEAEEYFSGDGVGG